MGDFITWMLTKLLISGGVNWFTKLVSNKKKRPLRSLYIMINGATAVGKTTAAEYLRKKYQISNVYSTDVFREGVRKQLEKEGNLTKGEGIGASSFDDTADYDLQNESILPFVIGTIRRSLNKRQSCIVEGINLEYKTIFEQLKGVNILYITISLTDSNTHKKRIRNRGFDRGDTTEQTQHYINNLPQIREIQDQARAATNKLANDTTNNQFFNIILNDETTAELHKKLVQAVKPFIRSVLDN